ncbi:hypothetical protein [Enterococcus sp. AZ007]|uniref:hypothetical protein n=1 Tax=Enterococcus sp. AZ007 TaxID=2774839 RepID=UPI003F20E5E7
MDIAMILNTKEVPLEMQKRFGAVYPLMLPFNEETTEDYLLKQYEKKDYVFIVSNYKKSPSKGIKLKKRKDNIYELYLDDSENKTLLSVVSIALQRIVSILIKDFSLTINFGDTIIQTDELDFKQDFVITGQKDDINPWTIVYREGKQLIFSNDIKQTSIKNQKQEQIDVVAGLFHFQSGLDLLESCTSISHILNVEKNDDDLDFYSAICHYDTDHAPISLIQSKVWLDFGHEKEYLQTKKMVQARFFNTIEIDDQRGILTKRSEEKEKLVNEIQWYLKMPSNLQYLTPRIYNYTLDMRAPEVSMEYYPYETLHTLYIYGHLEESEWVKIINKLFFVRKDMRTHSGKERLLLKEKDLLEIYYKKTLERIELLVKDSKFRIFYEESPTINGISYLPLKEILRDLKDILKQNQLLNMKTAHIIHGDFCLSNILFDKESRLVKLIDPRGKFGSMDIYGDEFYDLAKILHSFEGCYDHIITDQFELSEDTQTQYTYSIDKTPLQQMISSRVSGMLADSFPIEPIRLIEGLLFLSMIPLHQDYPKRQKVMFGQSMKLLKPYLDKLNETERTGLGAISKIYE